MLLLKKLQKQKRVSKLIPVRHVVKQKQKRFQLHPTIGIRERSQRKQLVQKMERKRIIVPMKDVIKHGSKRFLPLDISIQNSEIKKQPHAEKMATVEIFIVKIVVS